MNERFPIPDELDMDALADAIRIALAEVGGRDDSVSVGDGHRNIYSHGRTEDFIKAGALALIKFGHHTLRVKCADHSRGYGQDCRGLLASEIAVTGRVRCGA